MYDLYSLLGHVKTVFPQQTQIIGCKEEKTIVKEKSSPTIDSKYIQQHLANERTFLAWIRSGLTLIGVGYLAGKLHFFLSMFPNQKSDFYARTIGIASIVCGLITMIMATFSYFRKRQAINEQTFVATLLPIWIFGISSFLISILFLLYLLL